ncbi:uncharacterized protein STAUR_7874 [Stigmatella aurantiaca DW4/3-1]|uniref:Uncharacterized protein n=2 Tax=Stigmatella aurantiaca TaxID=41 RepID=E3FNF6_STIAD|nr:uncharacterized protein STAUR_7874 [Stigmatella aurantiaca DW4/3-1]
MPSSSRLIAHIPRMAPGIVRPNQCFFAAHDLGEVRAASAARSTGRLHGLENARPRRMSLRSVVAVLPRESMGGFRDAGRCGAASSAAAQGPHAEDRVSEIHRTRAPGSSLIRQFTCGMPVYVTDPLRVPIEITGKPLDFTETKVGLPVFHVRVASMFAELVPEDVQLVPVNIVV